MHFQSLLFSVSGPVGVGLNELKRKLLMSDAQHYGVIVPREFSGPWWFSEDISKLSEQLKKLTLC